MLTVLIVEDEDIARDGLRDCVEWRSYGIGMILEARDGIEGLAILESNDVDIVITDVEMPLMDGISMVKKMRMEGMDIPVIYLSGHWDLPYLKSAFKLDASDYLLKPIKFNELDQRLQKVTGNIEEKIEQKLTLDQMRQKLDDSMPGLIERFFHNLLHRTTGAAYKIDEKMAFLELGIHRNQKLCVITISPDSVYDDTDPMYMEKEMRLMYARKSIESMEETYKAYCVFNSDQRLSVIYVMDVLEVDGLRESVYDLHKSLSHLLDETLVVGVGKVVDRVDKIAESYDESIYALEQSIFLSNDGVIYYDDVLSAGQKKHISIDKEINLLKEYIRTSKQSKVGPLVDDIFRKLIEPVQLDMNYIKNVCIEILINVNMQLMDYRLKNEHLQSPVYSWEEIQDILQVDALKRWMKQYLIDACYQVTEVQNNAHSNIVYYITSAIEQRYNSNISIPILAKELALTPNYLYLLFKKEKGETFNKYLTKFRMEKAKCLILSPQYKLYEIAELVGYTNPDYFTKVFKNHYGCSPRRYRERNTTL